LFVRKIDIQDGELAAAVNLCTNSLASIIVVVAGEGRLLPSADRKQASAKRPYKMTTSTLEESFVERADENFFIADTHNSTWSWLHYFCR